MEAPAADQAPLFLIGKADRDIDLGGRMPVNVLELPVLSAISSIEELAASYLTVIQMAQPSGPYRLLGIALGGLVAYELASQLLGRDQRVEFLGLLNCPRPGNRPASGGRGIIDVGQRYCPQPLPIPLCHFVSQALMRLETIRSWRAVAGDSLRVIGFADTLTDDVLADEIAKTSQQQLLPTGSERDAAYHALVKVHAGPACHVPVIFVPGAGGSVASGLGLVAGLHPETTVYGLQPRGFNEKAVPYRTVQAAAAAYLRALREVQPQGPYRLVGHSFGGWVVFELACRLAAEGKPVDPIVLLDSQAPTPANSNLPHQGRVDVLMRLVSTLEELAERNMNLSREELLALDYESQLARLMQRMRELGVLPRNSDMRDVSGLVRVLEVNLNTSYVPQLRFPGCAILFQAAQSDQDGELCATREAWRNHVGHLECVSVPGKHMTMLKKPLVEAIASQLSRLWGESNAGNRAEQVRSAQSGRI